MSKVVQEIFFGRFQLENTPERPRIIKNQDIEDVVGQITIHHTKNLLNVSEKTIRQLEKTCMLTNACHT